MPEPKIDTGPVKEFFQKLGLDLNISGQLPLEGLAIKIIDAVQADRAGMSQFNRDRWDDVRMTMVENIHNGLVDAALAVNPNLGFRRAGRVEPPKEPPK